MINLGFFVSTVACQGWRNLFQFNWGGGAKGGEGGGEEGGLGACKRTLGTRVCRRVLPQKISKSILHIYVILKQNKMSSQQKVGI